MVFFPVYHDRECSENIKEKKWIIKMAVSELLSLIMDALSISETSVNLYQTTLLSDPEDIFHTRLREKVKSLQMKICFKRLTRSINWGDQLKEYD